MDSLVPVVDCHFVILEVVDSTHLISQQDMDDGIEDKQGHCRYHMPGLSRIAPYLKLEIMTAQLIQISFLIKPDLFFHVIPAVIVVEH